MAVSEIIETQKSLSKVSKICNLISILIKIIFVVFCAWWLVSSALLCSSLFGADTLMGVDNVNVIDIALYVADGIVVAVIFITTIKVFSDTAKGRSPFVIVQVRRLRLISLMLVLYTLLNTMFNMFTASNSTLWNYGQGVQSVGNILVAVDFAPLIAAGVVFAFSFVFKYGVLLQELSDDTL